MWRYRQAPVPVTWRNCGPSCICLPFHQQCGRFASCLSSWLLMRKKLAWTIMGIVGSWWPVSFGRFCIVMSDGRLTHSILHMDNMTYFDVFFLHSPMMRPKCRCFLTIVWIWTDMFPFSIYRDVIFFYIFWSAVIWLSLQRLYFYKSIGFHNSSQCVVHKRHFLQGYWVYALGYFHLNVNPGGL